MKATDLQQVVRFFDPKLSRPLSGDLLDAWFIQREGTTRGRLKLFLLTQNEPQKILFVGHRGSGKTTELSKLTEELQGHFHVVGFDAFDVVGRTNLEYQDLMRTLFTRVLQNCIEHGFVNQPKSEPVRRKLEEIRDWWQRVVAGLDFEMPPTDTEMSIQLQVLLANIELGAKQSSSAGDQLREQIDRQMTELIRHFNWTIEQVQAAGKRLLIIVEGMDKVNLEAAIRIFRDHAPTIIAPNASIIYTFPIALRHSEHANTIRLNFSDVYYLRNITTRHADGSDNQQGIETLRKLVLARMDEQLIEPEALDLLVHTNGGVPVWLVSLMRTAALFALERNFYAPYITCNDARNAIKELRREIAVPLTRHDWQTLRARHRDRQLMGDPDEQRLLYNGSLIDYSNGDPWCDAHPALWSLLEKYDDNADVEPTDN